MVSIEPSTSPYLSVQNGHRQLFPGAVPPTAEGMRPDSAHNPTVESIEELSDVGSFVVLAPPRQIGFSSSINSLVVGGTRRLVSRRT